MLHCYSCTCFFILYFLLFGGLLLLPLFRYLQSCSGPTKRCVDSDTFRRFPYCSCSSPSWTDGADLVITRSWQTMIQLWPYGVLHTSSGSCLSCWLARLYLLGSLAVLSWVSTPFSLLYMVVGEGGVILWFPYLSRPCDLLICLYYLVHHDFCSSFHATCLQIRAEQETKWGLRFITSSAIIMRAVVARGSSLTFLAWTVMVRIA